MKMNKGGTRYLAVIIIGIVSLLILIVFIKESYNKTDLASRVTACALAVKGMKDKSQFFGNDLGSPTYELTKLLSQECMGFKDNGNINNVFRAINYCWKEYGSGYNFLGEYNGSFCFICGNFYVKDLKREYKDNLKYLKTKDLFNEINGVNLNNITLSTDSVPDDDRVYVVYYARNVFHDTFNTKYDYFFNVISISSLLAKSNEGFFAGIFLVPATERDFESGVKEVKEKFENMGCDYVFVPNDMY